jgi:hypothetical protein
MSGYVHIKVYMIDQFIHMASLIKRQKHLNLVLTASMCQELSCRFRIELHSIFYLCTLAQPYWHLNLSM